jgi:hypothetical protein
MSRVGENKGTCSLGLIIYDHQRYNAYLQRTFFEEIGQFLKAAQKRGKNNDGGRINLDELSLLPLKCLPQTGLADRASLQLIF